MHEEALVEKTQVMSCLFPSKALLYSAYMPFVKGGGLFLKTNHPYPLGQELPLSLKIINEKEPYLIHAKIVWITPKGAQGNKPPGIGVQFIGENSRYLCSKIEMYLAELLQFGQLQETIW